MASPAMNAILDTAELRLGIWTQAVLSNGPVDITAPLPVITRVSKQWRRETIRMFFSQNTFELRIDCSSQSWIARQLQELSMALITIGPEHCAQIRRLDIALHVDEVQQWMAEPAGCNVSALGLIRLHPRTMTLCKEALHIGWRNGCEQKWRHRPTSEKPAMVEVLKREITKADTIGSRKRQALMLLCATVQGERLVSKGMARTAWSRMLNWSLRREVSQYSLLLIPMVMLIRDLLLWMLPAKDKVIHTTCESWPMWLAIEACRWGPLVMFTFCVLLGLWLRWDEDCHLKDD